MLKYQILVNYIRQQIARGELLAGDQIPPLAEMQTRFGVSKATVEKAYTLLEQEGLVLREQGSGTFVTEPHKLLPSGAIGLLAHTYSDSDNPYWMALLSGVQEAVRRRKLELMILHDEEQIQRKNFDGILVYQSELESYALRIPNGTPCVSMLVPALGLNSVVANDGDGIKSAVRHLISLGHRRIAYVLSSDFDVFSRRRLTGYRSALAEAGIAMDEKLIRYMNDLEVKSYLVKGEKSMRDWLADGWRELDCTAMLAPNDDTAIGMMKVLRENNLSVPEDVSIVGFDGTIISEYSIPRLTTIRVPLREIGIQAVELLADQIEERAMVSAPGEIRTLVMPVQFVARESTAPPKNQSDVSSRLSMTVKEK